MIAASATLACATAWRPAGSFPRSVQTRLALSSEPAAEAFLDGRPLGTTPLTAPLDYVTLVERERRKVGYWRAEPGWAAFLTVTSLGLYLPFGAIPVTDEEALRPTGRFERNRFRVELRAPGHAPWMRELEPLGEAELSLHAALVPEAQ